MSLRGVALRQHAWRIRHVLWRKLATEAGTTRSGVAEEVP